MKNLKSEVKVRKMSKNSDSFDSQKSKKTSFKRTNKRSFDEYDVEYDY